MQGHYALTNTIDFQGLLLFDRRESNQLIAPLPLALYDPSAFNDVGSGDFVSKQNVYNPFGIDVPRILRRLVEAPAGDIRKMWIRGSEAARFPACLMPGVTRHIGICGRREPRRRNRNRCRRGRSASRRVGSGTIVSRRCRHGALWYLDAVIADCVPMNVSAPGSITSEMLKYILYTGVGTQASRRTDVVANIEMDLAQLPAGPLGVSLGYEFRRDSSFVKPDPVQLAGFTVDGRP